MLKMSTNQSLKLITSLICCIINVTSAIAHDKLPHANYEAIYKLRLKWTIEDLSKELWPLQTIRENIANTIERLKKEKLLSYHVNKNFNAVYSKPQLFKGSHSPIPMNFLLLFLLHDLEEIGRVTVAYGLLPITLPLTAAYSAKKWLSTKDNDNEIAKLEKILPQIESDIEKIEQKIAETKTEAKELKGLENFIATYPSTYIRPAKISNYSTQSTSP